MISYFRKNFVFRSNNSFTLVEILVVVGILAIISTAGFVELAQFKSKHDFDLDSQSITEAIGSVQSRAIQQEGGSAWGIRFTNSTSTADTYQIFRGSSYSAASVVSSETLSSATVYSNPPPGFYIDVVFAARTGLPASGSATSIVINRTGGTGLYTIMISASGRISKNLETGLVGYWPMDEGGGATAYDASGNGNAGTITIGASGSQTTVAQAWANAAPSRVGVGLNFDGTDDYINALLGLYFGQNNPLTASSWVYTGASYSGPVFGVTSAPPGGGWNMPFLSINGSTVYGWIYGSTQLSSTITTNAWHMLTITYDPSGVGQEIFYVDGQSVGLSAGQYSPSGSIDYFTTYISGSKPTGVNSYLNTKIDDIRIYNRALSATEVQNLYNSY